MASGDQAFAIAASQFPLTLGIAMWIFFLGFLILLYQRIRRPYLYYPRAYKEGDPQPFWFSFENLQWIKKTIFISRVKVEEKGGMFGILYIRFMLYSLLFVFMISMVTLFVLIPVNIIIGNREGVFVSTTTANVPSGSAFLFVHTCVAVIIAVASHILAFIYIGRYYNTISVFLNEGPSSRSVIVRGLPRTFIPEEEVFSAISLLYPSDENLLACVKIPPDCQELLTLVEKESIFENRRGHAAYRFQTHGEAPVYRPGILGWGFTRIGLRETIDAVTFFEEKLDLIKKRKEELQGEEHNSCSVTFISFTSAMKAHRFLRDFNIRNKKKKLLLAMADQEIRERLHMDQWDVYFTPNPETILWGNLSTTPRNKILRTFILASFLIFSAFFWSFPLTIFASLDNLGVIPWYGTQIKDTLESIVFVREVVEGYFPALITTLFVILLPALLRIVCRFQKHDSEVELNASVFRLYYLFIIVEVLLFPTFLIGSLDSISSLLAGPGEVLNDIHFSLQGAFYINYIIQQTFFSGIIILLRPHHLLFRWLAIRGAVTKEEKEHIKRTFVETIGMEYRIRFAQMLVVLSVLMTYAVIVPLILVIGCIYFIVIIHIDINNIVHVYPIHVSAGSTIVMAVVNRFLIAIIMFEVLTAMFFYFKEGFFSCSCMVVLLLFSLVSQLILNILHRSYIRRFIRMKHPPIKETDISVEELCGAFVHPGLRTSCV